jgi:hypothetical protein
MKRDIWWWLERALVVAALLSIVSFGLLEFWFFKTSPGRPGVDAILPVNWHGTIVYVTAAQQLETDALFWGGPALLLLALGLSLCAGFANGATPDIKRGPSL